MRHVLLAPATTARRPTDADAPTTSLGRRLDRRHEGLAPARALARTIELPSKSRITRAGDYLRKSRFGPSFMIDQVEHDEATRIVNAFRASHAYPMQKVRYGLRSMIDTVGGQQVLGQRLKRTPRIVRKLHRMGNTRLASLEDIGGCRVVLRDGPELERLHQHLTRQWQGQVVRDRDYIAAPKAMGYRAVHLVVRRDDRAIEVQLRTRGQQEWADAVESIDNRLGLNLKDEDGPDEVKDYFRLAGEVIHAVEYHRPVSSTLRGDLDEARRKVVAAGFYSR